MYIYIKGWDKAYCEGAGLNFLYYKKEEQKVSITICLSRETINMASSPGI